MDFPPLFAAAPLKNVGVHPSTFCKSERLSGLVEVAIQHFVGQSNADTARGRQQKFEESIGVQRKF